MLTDASFEAVTAMFREVSGIRLGAPKRALVTGRLQKLAQARGLQDINQYVQVVMQEADPAEWVRVVDKLTTNETYFFREPQHYKHLAGLIEQRAPGSPELRVWSAASSSGEEAYSAAMVLADHLGLRGWQVVGTDLSTAMVACAQRGLYPIERVRDMPQAYLRAWCRKGHGEYEGQLLMARELRERVRFLSANLTRDLPDIGTFDVIFLRNVLIYFDDAGKFDIVQRVLAHLKPNGRLFTGHAESIANMRLPVRAMAPAIYGHAT
jgi:chemotaxis protein methyltransferase CheR